MSAKTRGTSGLFSTIQASLPGLLRQAAGLGGLALLATSAQAASNVRLQPVAPTSEAVAAVGADGGFAMSFGVHSTLPAKSPFEESLGGDATAFRFQTNTGYTLELAYGMGPEFEAGARVGIESYDSHSVSQTEPETILETASVSLYPVELVGRYRMAVPGWAPEAEAVVGVGLGTLTLSSTNQNFKEQSRHLTVMRGHVAGGMGYPWTEMSSLHVKAGFAFQGLGTKTFEDTDTGTTITQKSIAGLFLEANVRVQF